MYHNTLNMSEVFVKHEVFGSFLITLPVAWIFARTCVCTIHKLVQETMTSFFSVVSVQKAINIIYLRLCYSENSTGSYFEHNNC